MSNPRKPTAVLALSGSASKHKDRLAARVNEPVADQPLGNCPAHLNKGQKKIWKELTAQIPPYVATLSDRVIIEVAVRMIERMRHFHGQDCWRLIDGVPCMCCTLDMRTGDYATLNRALSQLGLTPADRSKIVVQRPAKKEIDPFAEFADSNVSEATQ